MNIFFSFRVCLVTKTRIKVVENTLKNFLSQLENGLFKQICEIFHFEIGMPPEPNIQKHSKQNFEKLKTVSFR